MSATVWPFWGRIAVAPSPVDETQTDSGLIVPDRYEGDAGVVRGVVVAVDLTHVEVTESIEDILPGTVVWYRKGVRVRDVEIVERCDILAYEIDGA